ncbi:hypothetical protein PoB_005866800 [Plakobranchus ocellatus]|uniref:Uncharacterized protein n=1 Tax=Plakobranchus ocellatus TaxID=259542 RepID=A0AAV4CKI9_9GAST|nr:hypothetical protein PoB_005866800 [Plakobranchus ocellatus]
MSEADGPRVIAFQLFSSTSKALRFLFHTPLYRNNSLSQSDALELESEQTSSPLHDASNLELLIRHRRQVLPPAKTRGHQNCEPALSRKCNGLVKR